MILTTILFYLETVTTGTVGTTTLIGDIQSTGGITLIIGMIILLGFIARRLDRWLNRYQGLDSENLDQEQGYSNHQDSEK